MLLSGLWKTAGYVQILTVGLYLPEDAKLELVQYAVFLVFYYCYPAYGSSTLGEESGKIKKLQTYGYVSLFVCVSMITDLPFE